jgi:hypothetical protein
MDRDSSARCHHEPRPNMVPVGKDLWLGPTGRCPVTVGSGQWAVGCCVTCWPSSVLPSQRTTAHTHCPRPCPHSACGGRAGAGRVVGALFAVAASGVLINDTAARRHSASVGAQLADLSAWKRSKSARAAWRPRPPAVAADEGSSCSVRLAAGSVEPADQAKPANQPATKRGMGASRAGEMGARSISVWKRPASSTSASSFVNSLKS